MKPIIQIFIAIIILIACFKLGRQAEFITKQRQSQKELTDFTDKQKEFYRKTHNGY